MMNGDTITLRNKKTGETITLRRKVPVEETPQAQEELASKMIPQFITGLASSYPGGRTITDNGRALPAGVPIEDVPEPRGFLPTFARGLGEIAPDLAMSTPFMGVAGTLKKAYPMVRAGLGYGAYAGTKAATQGQPVVPAALQGAGGAMAMRAGGRIGASMIPRSIPFGGRIGSAIGGAVVGGSTGDRKGMALGAGLGALYPAQRLEPNPQSTKAAETLLNFVLKPSKSLKQYANPARAIVKEGLWGRNISHLESKVDNRLNELNQNINSLKTDARNIDTRVNLVKNQALQPLDDLMVEFKKAPQSNRAAIRALQRNIDDMNSQIGGAERLSQLSIDEAYAMRDLVNNLKPNLWSGSSVGEARTANALRKTYHNIVEAINESGVSPDLRLINRRVTDLIAAKNAIVDFSKSNPAIWKVAPFPIVVGALTNMFTGGGAALGAGTAAALQTIPGATGIARLISQRYPQVPKVNQANVVPDTNIP